MAWVEAARRAGASRALLPALLLALARADPHAALPGAVPAASPGTLRFVATQEGTTLQGSFARFHVALAFDPSRPAEGSVDVRVEIDSVDAGAAQASGLLRGADFFDAARYPEARFEARGFRALADGDYEASGSFTLKGHSAALPVRFHAAPSPEGRWIDGSFVLSRLAYGVGQGEWSDTSTLDDAVTVRFHLLQVVRQA